MRDPPQSQVDDGALARLARDGDRDAYGELVRRHQTIAIRVAAQVGDRASAEDAAQEAFVKAFAALRRFDPERPFRPWLLAIVANESRDRVRDRRRGERLSDRLTATSGIVVSPGAEEEALARIGAERLVAAIGGLRDRDRELVTLRFVLDLGEHEAAAVLGCRPGTVKSRTSRALGRLRALLEESG